MAAQPVVLDTSVILNLLAADVGDAILRCLQTECLVTAAAAQETLYVRADDPSQPVRPVSVDPWRAARLIRIVAPEGLEEENSGGPVRARELRTMGKQCRSRFASRAGVCLASRRSQGTFALPSLRSIPAWMYYLRRRSCIVGRLE